MYHLTSHYGRETIHFVDQHQISQRSRGEEESVTFLQWHCRTKFGLVVVVSEVRYLIQITKKE